MLPLIVDPGWPEVGLFLESQFPSQTANIKLECSYLQHTLYLESHTVIAVVSPPTSLLLPSRRGLAPPSPTSSTMAFYIITLPFATETRAFPERTVTAGADDSVCQMFGEAPPTG